MVSIEFFQDKRSEQRTIDLLKSPIRSDVLENLTSLKFTNRIGSFTLSKTEQSWHMQSPRVMPAKTETINQIISTLRNIKIQTIHQHEPINFQSFSLDKPVIEMELLTKLADKIIIKIGLINPINNTSYITVSGHDRIYQTSIINTGMQSYELSDFIDANIFSMKPSEIKSLKIYQANNSHANINLSCASGIWQTNKYKQTKPEKIEAKVAQLLGTRTHMIIDKKDEKLQNFINNYLKNHMYNIKVTLNNGETVNYQVSHLIKAITDLKIEKKQYFLMTASNRPYPYVIHKSNYKNFLIKYSDIKN